MPGIELRIDVAPRLGGSEPLEIAATVFLPRAEALSSPSIAIFAVPGGGYSRGYFDMHFPGHSGYSEAEHHVARGFVLVACDPVGVGASTQPEPTSITFELLAATYDAAVREIAQRLEQGTIAPHLPPLRGLMRLGIGQSMGGKVTVLTQGRHATFDGIGVLGASAIHTVLPQRTEAARQAAMAGHAAGRDSDLGKLTLEESSSSIADFVYPFHWEDVPKDILDADMAGGYPVRTGHVPPFGSATIPPCAITMMSPGCIAAEAAAVAVPVLVGVGERDVCPDPHAEPTAYRNSNDVTVCRIPRMAHMHNFASTRAQLWRRIDSWSQDVAQRTAR
jgi:alpha-beta hydrolase superfamily lysophospholipase